jgi:hypothetical protein
MGKIIDVRFGEWVCDYPLFEPYKKNEYIWNDRVLIEAIEGIKYPCYGTLMSVPILNVINKKFITHEIKNVRFENKILVGDFRFVPTEFSLKTFSQKTVDWMFQLIFRCIDEDKKITFFNIIRWDIQINTSIDLVQNTDISKLTDILNEN